MYNSFIKDMWLCVCGGGGRGGGGPFCVQFKISQWV